MPDHRASRAKAPPRSKAKSQVKTEPSVDDPHQVMYFRRHRDDDAAQTCPGQEFVNGCPSGIRARLRTVLVVVADAPPTKFSGGGFWEAMHGDMAGWYEVRVKGGQVLFRLFCRLDYKAAGQITGLLVVITGLQKPNGTKFGDADYKQVRDLGDEYFRRNPRSLA
jgi:hypothetical protein